jgi:Arc/MetJ family transcription regulator
VITIAKRKTSLEIDAEKVDAAREILGTKTMTDTIDAALDATLQREAGRKLIEILDTPGALELDNPDVMKGAWRIGGRSFS